MLKLLMLLAVFLVVGCASGAAVKRDTEKTNEVMITFVQKAQAGFWKDAMKNVTPSERADMMENGQVLPEYREAVGRIRLSTIKNMDLGLDSKGRLVGLRDILDDSNSMYGGGEGDIAPAVLEAFSKQPEPVVKIKEEIEEEEEKQPEDDEFSVFLESLRKAASEEPSEAGSEE